MNRHDKFKDARERFMKMAEERAKENGNFDVEKVNAMLRNRINTVNSKETNNFSKNVNREIELERIRLETKHKLEMEQAAHEIERLQKRVYELTKQRLESSEN